MWQNISKESWKHCFDSKLKENKWFSRERRLMIFTSFTQWKHLQITTVLGDVLTTPAFIIEKKLPWKLSQTEGVRDPLEELPFFLTSGGQSAVLIW